MSVAPGARQTGDSRLRVEDRRLVSGRGRYVDDIVLSGMAHAAFARTPYAHARIQRMNLHAALRAEGVIAAYEGRAMRGLCKPIRAEISAPGLIPADWPVLAVDTVRFVGEAVAVVIAESRAAAAAAAELVEVDYDPLPVAADAQSAVEDGAPLVHREAGTNILFRHKVSTGGLDEALAGAHLVIRETFSTQRATGVPIEPRGYVAESDPRTGQLTLWSSTQVPHIVRTVLSQLLGRDETSIRVIAPDVGGGFGVKGQLFPEECVVAAMALALGRPVKWIETRREHMLASIHSREHRYEIEAGVSAEGRLLALRARVTVDAGAYSVYPYTISTEPSHASILLPGPYDLTIYECDALGVATNKCPIAPYRGVSRPPANFVTERLMDMIAHRLDLDPAEVRLRNLIDDAQFPYRSAAGFVYDSGQYKLALRRALAAADYERYRHGAMSPAGRPIGVGMSIFIESTAGGSASFAARGMPVAGFDMATVTVTPTARVEVATSAASQGQSHETVFAQIAADELFLPVDHIVVRGGDSAAVPYGTGTFGSRSAVMSGGAIILAARQVRRQAIRIAAHLMGASEQDVTLDETGFHATGARRDWAAVTKAAHFGSFQLPPGAGRGLTATAAHDLPPGHNPCSYGVHVAVVEVDPKTGVLDVLRYVILEDCGPMLNPMVVEGQVQGAFAQGIGTALMEALPYDSDGQLLAGTLMDYAMPRATDVPEFELLHLDTPSPYTLNGAKGMAEGAAVAPPAAIANALCNAFRAIGLEITDLPLTSERVWRAIRAARASAGAA